MYRGIIEPLAETAYVVAPDLPGFGVSSAPSADEHGCTFENNADTSEAFVAAIRSDSQSMIETFDEPPSRVTR